MQRQKLDEKMELAEQAYKEYTGLIAELDEMKKEYVELIEEMAGMKQEMKKGCR